MLQLLLIVLAAVCFALAAAGAGGRFNLVAAGLLAWLLAEQLPQLL